MIEIIMNVVVIVLIEQQFYYIQLDTNILNIWKASANFQTINIKLTEKKVQAAGSRLQ